MKYPEISIYQKASDAESQEVIPFDMFLDGVQTGRWQDEVLRVRTQKTKEGKEAAKKRLPAITVSGTFSQRNDNGLTQHSGFIVVDIDNLDNPEDTKAMLCVDPYVFAAFVSVGGRGLCLIVKIDPKRHRDAFKGLSEYFFTKYKVVCDPTSINVSRLRFVSFDPYIYRNDNSQKFATYPKDKEPKKIDRVLFVASDFDRIIKQIMERQLNLAENYHEWLRIGFGLVHQFGEDGRQYFHLISQYSAKYDPKQTDAQYNNCIKARGTNTATIATFYHYCKLAGVEIYSKETRTIAQLAKANKQAGMSEDQIKENLAKFAGITGADDIIKAALASGVSLADQDSLISQVQLWLRATYDLRRNSVTRLIECNGVEMATKDFNNIWIAAQAAFDKVSFEMIDRLINSDIIPTYNPFLEFFDTHKDLQPQGLIRELFECINTDTGNDPNFWAPDHAVYFGTKWLISIIASAHGHHSPLMLALCGVEQKTGKTEFFRRLLPDQLKKYYAESKLDNENDDAILMTKKLILMDDEMGGKSKREAHAFKSISSRATITVREPYARAHVDLPRLAVLCGTSNELALLSDITGNRRIIPINVLSIDHARYNAIDKVALFMEAYHLYKAGYPYEMSSADVDRLKGNTGAFEAVSAEYELIQTYLEIPTFQTEGLGVTFMTSTQIKAYLETASKQHINVNRMGMELRKLGWQPLTRRINGHPVKGYFVIIRGNSTH